MSTASRKLMSNRDLAKLASLYDLPDYVLETSLQDLQTPPQTDDHRYYADKREPYDFPVHTKAATHFSLIRWAEEQHQYPEKIAARISEVLRKHAVFWQIQNAAQKISTKRASIVQQNGESPDSDFAFVEVENGEKKRRYPLRNSLEVKAAGEWFVQYLPQLRERYSAEERQDMATRILDKAAQYGTAIGPCEETIERVAGQGTGHSDKIAAMLRERPTAAGRVSPEAKAIMLKFAEDIAGRSDLFVNDPSLGRQIVSLVEEFDRQHGLLNKYSAMLPAPEDVVYEDTRTKMASQQLGIDEVTLLSGTTYPLESLRKLSKNGIADLFGRDAVEELLTGLQLDPHKVAEFAETLPLPDAHAFDSLMVEAGVLPRSKRAAEEVGLSLEDWLQILDSPPTNRTAAGRT